MSTNSFKARKSVVLTPNNLSELPTPEAGEIACDINDSNKIKRYDATSALWVEIGASSSSYTDVTVPALNIDWSSGNTFYKSISAASTFTFSNIVAGKTITLVVFNSGASAVDLIFPTVSSQAGAFELAIINGKANVYVFTSVNGAVYASSISEVA